MKDGFMAYWIFSAFFMCTYFGETKQLTLNDGQHLNNLWKIVMVSVTAPVTFPIQCAKECIKLEEYLNNSIQEN